MALLAIMAAATVALPPDLAKAAAEYDQAQVKGDRAALERLLADDYVLRSSSGHRETKAQFIADQVAPGYRLNPFKVEQPYERVMGEVALLGGVATLTGTDGGKPYTARLRFLDVWQKRGGRWQVVFTDAGRAGD
jgi:ketosteroid isomerase-like protein